MKKVDRNARIGFGSAAGVESESFASDCVGVGVVEEGFEKGLRKLTFLAFFYLAFFYDK